MAQELSALPESFAAGTIVKYRKRFADLLKILGWNMWHRMALSPEEGTDIALLQDASQPPSVSRKQGM